MKKFVAYYRVSTQKQGDSGLGLAAQQDTVKKFAGDNEIIAEYTEIESGKNDKRIELQNAIEFANTNNATLVISKLDRLSRNVSFIFQLRDSKVDFVCCDLPDANTMTIGIFALLAQQERELISERTKKALQAKKAKGFILGKPENLTEGSRERSIEVRKIKAVNNENNRKAFALIDSMRKQNVSYNKIADNLNNCGFKTSTGKSFYAMSVKQLYDRCK
ncbi:MAG: recombinase family protein [Lutibacter sp.]|jgi:DNA invertase Pin-like site-specific DNA recombinase